MVRFHAGRHSRRNLACCAFLLNYRKIDPALLGDRHEMSWFGVIDLPQIPDGHFDKPLNDRRTGIMFTDQLLNSGLINPRQQLFRLV
jgi:hypothetical protein